MNGEYAGQIGNSQPDHTYTDRPQRYALSKAASRDQE